MFIFLPVKTIKNPMWPTGRYRSVRQRGPQGTRILKLGIRGTEMLRIETVSLIDPLNIKSEPVE